MTAARLPATAPSEQAPSSAPRDLGPLFPEEEARRALDIQRIVDRWVPTPPLELD